MLLSGTKKVSSECDAPPAHSVTWSIDKECQYFSVSPRFYLDDEELTSIEPGAGGFWELGNFDKDVPGIHNPWASDGDHMAPFDREVCSI